LRSNEFYLSADGLAELTDAVLARNSSFRFRVRGYSMSPCIRDGDVVTLSVFHAPFNGLGRPAAFRRPYTKKLVIHRIIGASGSGYLIKGDNAFETDGLIPKENILGYVSKVERGGRERAFGLGAERYAIAFLSRTRLLGSLFWSYRVLSYPFRAFRKAIS
jgi:hypothetical protein